jgi:lipoprotein-releasing system permease protein
MASHASVHGYDGPLADWRALRERALRRGDVVAAAPFVEGQALVAAGDSAAGLSVRGVDPELEQTVSAVGGFMRAGSLQALEAGAYRAVIGSGVAEALDVGIGDEVVLVLARGVVTPIGITPRMRTFTVGGIFEAGMYEYDRGLAFVHFEDAARMFGTDGHASGLRLAVSDVYAARIVATELAETLEEPSYVNDWTRQHINFFNSIRLSKTIMFVILSMVVAVAAFNIVSTLVMVVRDKKGDIAILRSFGASPRSIMTMFASQGTMIGLAGTLLGLLLGLLVTTQLHNVVGLIEAAFDVDLLSAEVYFLGDLPSQVRSGEILKICGVALALAVAATIYPAFSAARMAPAEALRYE